MFIQNPETQRAIGAIILAARNVPEFQSAWLVDPAAAIASLDIPDQLKADLCAHVRASGVAPAISLAWLQKLPAADFGY